MTTGTLFAVNGASGYTGRLVIAELARRGLQAVLVGRNPDRLRSAGPAAFERRIADIADRVALVEAFRGCDVVINCAGPFSTLGEPVVRASIAAGCHYVDTTGEQGYIMRVFESCAEDAERAEVSVVPGMAEDGGPSDLISHLVGERVGSVDALTVALWYRGLAVTRGTMRSMLAIADQPVLRYQDGLWIEDPSSVRDVVVFPGSPTGVPVAAFPLPPVATVPRHVAARRVDGLMNADLLAAFGQLTPELIEGSPEGPSETERAGHRWTIVADAAGSDGRSARGFVEGSDGYGTTAVIAVQAAHLLAGGGAKAGVLAPAEAFDAADFLNFLAPHGVRWNVG